MATFSSSRTAMDRSSPNRSVRFSKLTTNFPCRKEQMATLQKNGSEILARNLPKKRGEGEQAGSDTQPPVAPTDTIT